MSIEITKGIWYYKNRKEKTIENNGFFKVWNYYNKQFSSVSEKIVVIIRTENKEGVVSYENKILFRRNRNSELCFYRR